MRLPRFRNDRSNLPEQAIDDGAPVRRVALLGADYPGMRPKMLCAQGDRVRQGQPLFQDRAHPEVVFVAPLAGIVETITLGPKRRLSALVVRAVPDGRDAEPVAIATTTAVELRTTLLAHGLWAAFSTRPFGRIPEPEARPEAIFVTAIADNLQAPDPRIVLDGKADFFVAGLRALALLTEGTVHVCQGPGPDLAAGLGGRIRSSVFAGGPSPGLAGTHIHRLHPVRIDCVVWSIGYQDVAAIGQLIETGAQDFSRIVSLTGPRARRPRLIRTIAGANLQDLIRDEPQYGDDGSRLCIVSGPVLTGRPASWLGRYHHQITLLDEAPLQAKVHTQGMLARWRQVLSRPGPLIPTAALERALAFGIPPVPLLRALSVGDADAASRLGCLEMVEEDLAGLSLACTSGADYGRMLRHVLDELAEDA
jgi:Na+-transporting NADH:ubiquinone oxidoreductase subunit A